MKSANAENKCLAHQPPMVYIIMSGPTRKDNFKILKKGQKPEIKLHRIYVF